MQPVSSGSSRHRSWTHEDAPGAQRSRPPESSRARVLRRRISGLPADTLPLSQIPPMTPFGLPSTAPKRATHGRDLRHGTDREGSVDEGPPVSSEVLPRQRWRHPAIRTPGGVLGERVSSFAQLLYKTVSVPPAMIKSARPGQWGQWGSGNISARPGTADQLASPVNTAATPAHQRQVPGGHG